MIWSWVKNYETINSTTSVARMAMAAVLPVLTASMRESFAVFRKSLFVYRSIEAPLGPSDLLNFSKRP